VKKLLDINFDEWESVKEAHNFKAYHFYALELEVKELLASILSELVLVEMVNL
jgi:hypothetical protein